MIDHNDDKYKNHYTKETSQIHAPADLIRKTKQAMSEEETKLKMENADTPKIRMQKIFKWALPATAAAVLVLTLNTYVMLWGGGAEKSRTDYVSDTGADGSYEGASTMNSSSETITEESNGKNAGGAETEGSAEITEGAEKSDDAENAMPETEDFAAQQEKFSIKDEINTNRSEADSLSRGGVDNLAETESADQNDSAPGALIAGTENSQEKKYSKEDSSSEQITIKEVETAPDFCNDSDTKRIVCHEITFYVAEDADETADTSAAENIRWKVYTEYNGGRYIITGQASGQDEFSERAYEILKEASG